MYLSFFSSSDGVGRVMPLLVAFLLFRCDEEGHIPLLIVSFLFQHGGEGHAPSPLCLCLIFNASGRGIPLLVVFLLFQRDEEGIPFSHSCFNTARRDVPSSCLHFTSDRQ